MIGRGERGSGFVGFWGRAKRQLAARLCTPLAGAWHDTRGQSLIEYLIVIGACALIGIAGFSRYGRVVKADLAANARHIEGEGLPGTESLLNLVGADYNEVPGWCVKPSYCFAAGTPVQTETGDRPIESIVKGDRIWARDVKTGAVALRTVINTSRTPSVPVIDLGLTTSHGGTEQLVVTRGHLFWVEGAGWVRADALAAQPLWSTEAELSSKLIRTEPEPTTVYNLEVSEFHSYFVGHSHVLVHNGGGSDSACADPPPTTSSTKLEASDLCPTTARYKDANNNCCADEEGKDCKCAAQIRKVGHELEANFEVNGEQVDIQSKPGACSEEKDQCHSSDIDVDVTSPQIQDELKKKAFTSMCGGTSSPIKPGAFLAAQLNKKKYGQLSKPEKDYYAAFGAYCDLLEKKLGGTTGNTAALLRNDPDVQQAANALLGLYKGLPDGGQLSSDQITNNGGNAYHTEPKLFAFLENWAAIGGGSLYGGKLEIGGTASPCAKCDQDLADFARAHHVAITYCFEAIYKSGKTRKNGPFFSAPKQKGDCSIAYNGCVVYSPSGGMSFTSKKDQKQLCAAGVDSCKSEP